MATSFVGEIRMFAGNFAPVGWAFCDGSSLPISEYETLFNLIGTIYGGDGQETFNVPDLRGRLPIHGGTLSGTSFVLGQPDGAESVTLTTTQLPAHTHSYNVVNGGATSRAPQNATWAATDTTRTPYTQFENAVQLQPTASVAGGSQPHENRMPYLCVSFIISLYGIFPQQG